VAAPERVRGALGAHGLAEPARAAVAGWVRRLVAVTRETGAEHAMMFDADSGAQLDGLLAGERKWINIAPLLGLMRPDGAYCVVHTHTSDGAFSDADPLPLFLRPPVRAIVVVGARGTVYAMSRSPSWTRRSYDDLLQAYRETFDSLRRATADAIADGTMPRWRAESEQVHGVWTRIAGPFGLRYTRAEVSGR
jgi:hypothetical protein